MKKVISIILTLCLVLALCACGSEKETAMSKEFRVGYARENITPQYSVPLAGYGNTSSRMSQGFISYLYTTCIAITDADDSTILLFTTDMIGVTDTQAATYREAVSKATGIPGERIMFTNTHTHSAPDYRSSEPVIQTYLNELAQHMVTAAKEALADRSAATMETGIGKTERLNFVRHYTTTSGEIFGDNLSLNGTITGHTSEPDTEIQLICFRRAAKDKKDILAVNWQCHPRLDSAGTTDEGKINRPMMSADYVGAARDYVEANTDCLFAFYLGAAGNLNAESRISGENFSTACKVYGGALGGHIIDGMESLKPVEGDAHKVTVTQKMYDATYDHAEDNLVAEAQRIASVWYAKNDYNAAMAEGTSGKIYSQYHASSIVSRSKNTAETCAMELNAIRVGPIGFITAPYEMFDVSGMAIKDGSPFDTTFVMTCANGSYSYIAAEYAFQGRGTYEVHNRNFVQGTAEDLVTNYLGMLNELNQ